MPIKSCGYRKRNNKSLGTRKNKTTRGHKKKQMKEGGTRISSVEEYKQKQESINGRINDIFSGRKLIVAKYKGDTIVITKTNSGELITSNYEEPNVVKYDFTKHSFLNAFDKGELNLIQEN